MLSCCISSLTRAVPLFSYRIWARRPNLHLKKLYSTEYEQRTLPACADVIVIGGGCIGCSTAYHLAKQGVGNVVLLEKAKITSGTTWHTDGLLWSLRNNRGLMEMQLHTRELANKILPEENGMDAGWQEGGSLYLTRNKKQLSGLELMSLLGSQHDVSSRMIDPEEITRVHPLIDTKGLLGALYTPQDGTLDPTTLCTSLIKAGQKYGLKVVENCTVTDIRVIKHSRTIRTIDSVETNLGKIKTEKVVNCAGCWAPYIAEV